MLFQSIGKPQYLNFALIAGLLLGIGSLSNVAIGQEKCEDSVPEVLEKFEPANHDAGGALDDCLLYTSPSPRDQRGSRMPSSA